MPNIARYASTATRNGKSKTAVTSAVIGRIIRPMLNRTVGLKSGATAGVGHKIL
jgi:hypothetical protein